MVGSLWTKLLKNPNQKIKMKAHYIGLGNGWDVKIDPVEWILSLNQKQRNKFYHYLSLHAKENNISLDEIKIISGNKILAKRDHTKEKFKYIVKTTTEPPLDWFILELKKSGVALSYTFNSLSHSRLVMMIKFLKDHNIQFVNKGNYVIIPEASKYFNFID